MKIGNFFVKLANEGNYKAYFKQRREASGIVSRRCGDIESLTLKTELKKFKLTI